MLTGLVLSEVKSAGALPLNYRDRGTVLPDGPVIRAHQPDPAVSDGMRITFGKWPNGPMEDKMEQCPSSYVTIGAIEGIQKRHKESDSH